MHKSQISNVNQALAYIVDCTLATVCDMASRSRRPKGEYERQISIAQSGIDWMRQFGVDFSYTRAHQVVTEHRGSVANWAERFYPQQKP